MEDVVGGPSFSLHTAKVRTRACCDYTVNIHQNKIQVLCFLLTIILADVEEEQGEEAGEKYCQEEPSC